jgi:energy-converting hydrogenase A subunit P
MIQGDRYHMKTDKEKSTPRFNKETCIACAMCVDICPAGVLELHIANSIHGFHRFPMLTDAENCTGCFSCEKECPTGSIIMAI